MKRRIDPFVLCILVALTSVALWTLRDRPVPKVSFRDLRIQAVHEFGTIAGDQERRYVFRLRNSSAAVWRIERAWTYCGCLKVVKHSQRVEPGRDLTVEVKLDTRGRYGEIAESVFVHTGQRILRLEARALVTDVPSIERLHILVALPRGESNFEARNKITIPATSDQSVSLKQSGPAPGLTVSIARETVAQLEQVFSVRVRGELKQAQRFFFCRLVADVAGRTIPVDFGLTVRRERTVGVSPRLIAFEPSGRATDTVRLFGRGSDIRARVEPAGVAAVHMAAGEIRLDIPTAAPNPFEVVVQDKWGDEQRVPVYRVRRAR